MAKIVLSGYYGFQNSGDDAILEAIVDQFQEMGLQEEIVVLSNAPEITQKQYGVKSVNRFSAKEVWATIKACELFISGGGTLLQDGTSSKSLWYYLLLLFCAKVNRKKTMIFASGLGPIDKKGNQILTRWILRKVDIITLRDTESQRFSNKIGVKKEVFVTADPVFGLKWKKEKAIDYLKRQNLREEDRYIGVSVRPWKEDQKAVEEISRFLNQIAKERRAVILFLPMRKKQDLKISKEIGEKLQCPYHVVEESLDVKTQISLFAMCEYLIAMRLHALIYGALSKRKLLGISYDVKVEALMKDLKWPYWVSYQDLSAQGLKEIFDKMEKNSGISFHEYEEAIETLKTKAKETALNAIALLKENESWKK